MKTSTTAKKKTKAQDLRTIASLDKQRDQLSAKLTKKAERFVKAHAPCKAMNLIYLSQYGEYAFVTQVKLVSRKSWQFAIRFRGISGKKIKQSNRICYITPSSHEESFITVVSKEIKFKSELRFIFLLPESIAAIKAHKARIEEIPLHS